MNFTNNLSEKLLNVCNYRKFFRFVIRTKYKVKLKSTSFKKNKNYIPHTISNNFLYHIRSRIFWWARFTILNVCTNVLRHHHHHQLKKLN